MKLGNELFAVVAGLGVMSVPPLVAHRSKAPQGSSEMVKKSSIRTAIAIGDGTPVTSALVRERLCGETSPCENGKDGIDGGVLKSGIAPPRPVTPVVETDENCVPDADGISHCTNALWLPDGSTLTLGHDHDMQTYPCLRPDEVVRLEGQSST